MTINALSAPINYSELQCGTYLAKGRILKVQSKFFFISVPSAPDEDVKHFFRKAMRFEIINAVKTNDLEAYEGLDITAKVELHSFSIKEGRITLHQITGPASPYEIYDLENIFKLEKKHACKNP